MLIKEGIIIPGKCISPFYLGMSSDDVMSILEGDYSIEERGEERVFWIENAAFFFNKEKKLFQIGVSYGFESKFENKIGIGDTMALVKKEYGEYFEDYDVYLIRGIETMSFELGETDDEDDWNELEAPIEWIWVYDMSIRDGV